MARFKLSVEAKADLLSIAKYSEKEWGKEQAKATFVTCVTALLSSHRRN